MSISTPQSSPHPSVQITFDGLLLFAFEKDNSRCVIGTAKCDNHCLEIIIDGAEAIVTTAKNISIYSDSNKGIRQYRPGKDMVRHASCAGDLNDLGWLMAIQGDQFHNDPNLPKNLSAIEQRIQVSTGIFYTALRTSDASIITSKGPSEFSTIATMIGCNISLAEGEVLTLAFDERVITFSPGETTRKIEIKYICHDSDSSIYGDFRAFYEIYNTVREEDKFGVISNNQFQRQRGLGIQNMGPTQYCPPIEGEPPIG